MTYLLMLFYNIMGKIRIGDRLTSIGIKWEREAYTRADFQKLCDLSDIFNELEFERLLRATYYRDAPDGPFIIVKGKKWRLIPE